MPKNRKLQNIIGTEHITDSAEAAIAAQAASGNVLDDTSPQLGDNLDVNGNALVSTSNGNIELNPNGSGKVVFKGNATKGAGQFKLNCEQNTHGIVIKGPPHSAAASYTLTLPDTDGAANEVLKTDGSGNLDWVAQSGGGGQIAHASHLNVDIFGSDSSLVSIHSLLAAGKSGALTQAGTTWNDTTTTRIHFMPAIMAQTGTVNAVELRVGNPTAGDTIYFALYASDANGLPNGAAAATFTITPTINTNFTANITISGVSRGDLYYLAWFGQTNITNLWSFNTANGGTFSVPRGLSVINQASGGAYQSFYKDGETNGNFPTLSASTEYDGTRTFSQVPRIAITFS